MLQIPISHDDAHSCLDDVIAAIADWYGCGYELMFSESWEFKFTKPKSPHSTIGEHILPGENRSFDLVGIYHGLIITFHDVLNAEQLVEIIKESLSSEKPISIYIDSFWCPWHKGGYQDHHNSHYCIVVGIDEVKGVLYCIDGQWANTPAELPMDLLKKGYKDYIEFTLIKDHRCEFDWQKIIDNYRVINEKNNMFSNMVELADYLRENLNMNHEIKGHENYPNLAPIFQQLFKVSRGRKQFAKALKYIGEEKGVDELIEISGRMQGAGDTWSSIFGMLIKSMYLENPKQIFERVSNKIIEASDYEKSLAEDLIKISSGLYSKNTNHIQKENTASFEAALTDYCYVNLDKHFNNLGFSKLMTQDCTAEFSNVGRYYLNEGLPENREWIVDSMRFNFPQISEGKYDNISCAGQKLSVESNKRYSTIMFLGCAELGNHSEEAVLEYEDGTSESTKIEFTSWLSNKPTFEEYIAWSGKAALRGLDNVIVFPFTVQIFAKAFRLSNRKVVKSIILPQCPNIHVFAISLGI